MSKEFAGLSQRAGRPSAFAVTLSLCLVFAAPATAQTTDAAATLPSSIEAMSAATEKAQATLPNFFRRLAKPKPRDKEFAVKIKYQKNGVDADAEHIWANAVVRHGDMVTATINKAPRDIPDLKLGQRVTVPVTQLSDWMFIRDRKFYGAYSLRAVLTRLPDDQAAGFRAMLAPEGEP